MGAQPWAPRFANSWVCHSCLLLALSRQHSTFWGLTQLPFALPYRYRREVLRTHLDSKAETACPTCIR